MLSIYALILYWKHAFMYIMPINLGYWKISYRNTVSILVFQAKVVNFQETKLLACLIEENATRCLWLQWKVIAISNTFWYNSKILRQLFCDNLSIRMIFHGRNQCERRWKMRKSFHLQLIKYSKSRIWAASAATYFYTNFVY